MALGLVECLALGCLNLRSPPLSVRLFVLESTAAPAPATAVRPPNAADPVAVGIGPLSVPDYARSRLVHRVGPNEVRLSETEQWAEPLAAGLQRVLVTNLAALLGSERVVAHPWRPEVRPEWWIEIRVLRFERGANGAAELEAQWTLRRSRDLAVVRQATSRLTRTPNGQGPDALVAAFSASLAEWSEELAAAVREAAATPRARAPSRAPDSIRGSIVGTRPDLMEALAIAGEGKVRCHYSTEELDRINAVFDRMRTGTIEGRVVLRI